MVGVLLDPDDELFVEQLEIPRIPNQAIISIFIHSHGRKKLNKAPNASLSEVSRYHLITGVRFHLAPTPNSTLRPHLSRGLMNKLKASF